MDVEKTMQFILDQNAKNTVQIEKLWETVKAHEEVVKAHENDLQVHTEWKTGMSQALQDLAGQMADGFRKVDQKLAKLADMQKTTEENLNILIRTVQEIIPRIPPPQ